MHMVKVADKIPGNQGIGALPLQTYFTRNILKFIPYILQEEIQNQILYNA